MMRDYRYWITALEMAKHPEGGYFKEVYRCREFCARGLQKRNLATSIYFLLPSTEVSCFHRLKSDELWYYHAGSPLTIYIIDGEGQLKNIKLGLDAAHGESLQVIVQQGSIFGAVVDQPDSYTLMGCMVAPGFDYCDFELMERGNLIEKYPQHREIILRLTRN